MGKLWENSGKSWEESRKHMENHGKNTGKIWNNWKNMGKT